MQHYYAFGGCLRSALEFPDLSPCSMSDIPDWEVELSASEPTESGSLQGEREVGPDWVLRLYRIREGWRLDYGATGSYEVLAGGRRIVWYQGTDRREEVARAVILGPIMALVLHESGILCLHGSAVSLGKRGMGFLAPKGYGKSTLAVALTAAGGRLMSDDLVAVTLSEAPEILPSVHSIRMFGDVTEVMAGEFPGALFRDGWKKTLTNFPADLLEWERAALDALYLIHPVADGPVERTPVTPMEAALSLARHSKIADLLGHVEAGKMLGWIGEVVGKTPVYQLDVPRELERLPSVASQILDWHRDL